ncbi:MAG: chromosomal replication initiator protein DnaA [Candidatus Liptonbacteria bacterium]|nr:chromosomal replication initiator protein DnaA [Candidatus Liptonbacteria bacterium]
MEKNLEKLWQSVLGEMEVQLSRANFATWLKNSQLADERDGTLFIILPNNFAKEWVENKYHKNILGIARNFDDSVRKLEFMVSGQKQEFALKKPRQAEAPRFENKMNLEFRVDPESNLNPRYTLNSFVVGSSNELAFSAANAVIQAVGAKYNPLFIYGGVGLGKTHLIQSMGNEIKAKYGGKIRPKYVSSEKFTSDIVWAIRNKRMEDIKKKYRDVDVLIIDDIQFIGGKEKTEEEFFHTFNALYENNKQIIISSDRPPQSIPTLEERLRSRFEGGLIVDIVYPEYEMRVAIIKSKLQESNRELSDQIINIVANKIRKNVRELEGVINKLIFYQDMKSGAVTEKVVEEIIEKTVQNFSRRVSDTQIIKSVVEFYGISASDIVGKIRRKEIVEPRQVAMYLLRDILDMSYPYIGEKLGKDHTTAIHAVKKINREINKNSSLFQKIITIKELIYKPQ